MKRMTKQRTAILKCLSETERPLCVEEIQTYASAEIPQINLSTIYRTIKTLIQEKKIALIELPGERSCYELCQKEHRHYFLCDSCDKVYVINQCPNGLSEIIPEGFHLLGHSITLNGFCATCQR